MHASRAALVALCLVACLDPGDRFDAFGRRLRPQGSPSDAATEASPGDAASCDLAPGRFGGPHWLVLSVSLAPTKPILVLLSVQLESAPSGAELSFDAQPLSAADRRTPVGAPIHAGPFTVRREGTFQAALPGLVVTGAANPITGADIAVDVTLVGSLCRAGGLVCGEVQGHVTAPINLDLAGSTFTMIAVPGPTDLPDPLPIDCAGDPADPLAP